MVFVPKFRYQVRRLTPMASQGLVAASVGVFDQLLFPRADCNAENPCSLNFFHTQRATERAMPLASTWFSGTGKVEFVLGAIILSMCSNSSRDLPTL